jgi:hypothetical protein
MKADEQDHLILLTARDANISRGDLSELTGHSILRVT